MRAIAALLTLVIASGGVASGRGLPENTDEITALSVEEARSLVTREPLVLTLDGLTSLPVDVARALALHPGRLHLDRLVDPSDELLEALATHENDLSLGGLASLTDRQAEILGDHGRFLWLKDAFDGTPVEPRAPRRAGRLFLNGVTSLTVAQAESLGRHEGALFLGGVTTLGDDEVEALTRRPRDLHLFALTGMTDRQARLFGDHRGALSLSGVVSLSPAQADALSRHEGSLSLGGLASLTDGQAEELSRHAGDLWLFSSSLTTLSDHQAESLSRRRGDLYLAGVTTITAAQARSLAKQPGNLALFDLTEASDEVIAALATHRGSAAHGQTLELESLPSLTEAQAEALSRHAGPLSLGNVVLSASAARALATHDWLSLSIHTLSDEATEALARQRGTIYLTPLTMTDEQAEVWASWKGGRRVFSARNFTDRQIEILSRNRGITFFP